MEFMAEVATLYPPRTTRKPHRPFANQSTTRIGSELDPRAPMLVMLASLRDINDGPLGRALISFYTSALTTGDGC
jgi:hypothetical protein